MPAPARTDAPGRPERDDLAVVNTAGRPDPRFMQDNGVTPLACAVLALLESERDYPPKSVKEVCRVMHVTGQALEPAIPVVESALAELMRAGQVERVHSARLGARFKIMKSVQAGNIPESAISNARE